MGLIIGAAALTIDYAKVSALRNESQTATSAAALAAAKSLVSSGPVSGGIKLSLQQLNGVNGALSEAKTVYQEDIAHTIHHTGLGNLKLTYSVGKPSNPPETAAQLSQQSIANPITVPIYIHASASGATSMNFGAALGISAASVRPESTAVFYADTSAVNNSNFVPLGMPNTHTYSPGQTFYAYRGDSGNGNSPPTTPTPIEFFKIYGSGSNGWLQLNQQILQVGTNLNFPVKGTPGTSPWNFLPIQEGDIVIFPVANKQASSINGNTGTVPLIEFITAKINAVNLNSQGKPATGKNAGFTFTVLSDTAENDWPSGCVIQKTTQTLPSYCSQGSTPYYYSYSLAPNS
jgi:hypothetical protein